MSVERVDRCDEETLGRFVQAGEPVVFTGLVRAWPAHDKWGPDYLAAACGERKLPVAYYPDGKHCAGERPLTVREYLDVLATEPDGPQRYYLETNPLSQLAPELYKDLAFPGFLERQPGVCDMVFFGKDTGSCCHLHPFDEAVVCQVFGRKTFHLYHPRDVPNLYLQPFYRDFRRSRIDFGQVDFDRYPRVRRLRPISVELEGGDALYVPVQWPHWTLGDGLNFTLTRFWNARLRHYRFPTPGIHCLLGKWFHALADR
jgi:hypothetical protein